MEAYAAQQGNQQGGRQGRKRRSWTQMEERVLLQAFMEIIAHGWKTQNGFRNGFLIQLENEMKAAIPGTDLKGEPMISSKYGTWKKTFKDIQEVLRSSAFGWNSTTKTVLAYPSSVWDDFIQAHPGLAYIRKKPFPMYEAWVEIFGRDTATGNRQQNSGTPNFTCDDTGAQSSATPNPSATPGANGNSNSGMAGAPVNHKRKRVESNEDLAEAISAYWEKASAAMNKIAARMGHEMDAVENRKWLYDAIGQLPVVIDMPERLRASIEIAMNQRAIDVFIGLPVDAKIGLVHMALDGELKCFK